MVDAAHGLRYEFDEPGLTAEAEDRLWELSERALAEVTAGGGVAFDPGRLTSVRYRVIQSDEAEVQLKALPPEPKRRVRGRARRTEASVVGDELTPAVVVAVVHQVRGEGDDAQRRRGEAPLGLVGIGLAVGAVRGRRSR